MHESLFRIPQDAPSSLRLSDLIVDRCLYLDSDFCRDAAIPWSAGQSPGFSLSFPMETTIARIWTHQSFMPILARGNHPLRARSPLITVPAPWAGHRAVCVDAGRHCRSPSARSGNRKGLARSAGPANNAGWARVRRAALALRDCPRPGARSSVAGTETLGSTPRPPCRLLASSLLVHFLPHTASRVVCCSPFSVCDCQQTEVTKAVTVPIPLQAGRLARVWAGRCCRLLCSQAS